ncbi:MAG TPA: SpoIID/LytB domain-containing protein [Gaiellaceae bacterium]
MRRLILVFSIAVALAAGAAATARAAPVCTGTCFTAPAGSGPLFLVTGHGWGHGVGMSQYGAYGYAQHGATYQQILAHYYPSTTLDTASSVTFRVLLADQQKRITIVSTVPFSAKDANGTTVSLDAGSVAFGPGLRVAGQTLVAPIVFSPGKGGALTLKRSYRGRIQVDLVDGKLRAVNVVSLEQYLYGVVPAEMPKDWSADALKAQAVAARSYALATRNVAAPYDAYADTRSQMYLGLSVESPSTTAAVNATKRQVLMFDGKVATTYFYSTSGGRTESSMDWIGTPLPYLVSVPDPYDAISPYHDWGPVPMTAQAIAKALKIGSPITDATTVPNAAGRVAKLNFVTAPATVSVSARTLEATMGLRSTWFSLGMLSLTAPVPSAPVTYGAPLTLAGLVRGVTGVSLEQRPAGGTWQAVGPVGAGTLKLTQRPTVTTDYRLATATAAGAFVRVRVAPSVTLQTFTTTEIAGTEQPVLPGAPVAVQQENPDLTWTTVATTAIAADGTFSVPVALTSGGTYRVTVGPATGFVAATTAPQPVVR